MVNTKTQNSRNFADKVKMYQEDGWEVEQNGHCKRVTRWGTESRMIVDDGSYDPWYPLPEICEDGAEDLVRQAIIYNKEIAEGATNATHNGHIPSAWLDFAGARRNVKIYETIKKQYKEELNRKKFYQRDGKKFIRVKL